jgi:hypothetical protein
LHGDSRRFKCTEKTNAINKEHAQRKAQDLQYQEEPSTSNSGPQDRKAAFRRKLEHLVSVGGITCPTDNSSVGAPEYGIMDIHTFNNIYAEAPDVCPDCESGAKRLVHVSGDDSGLAKRLDLVCGNCESVLVKGSSSPRIEGGRSAFDVNKRCVFAMRNIDCGFSELDRFIYMNMASYAS